MVSRRSGSPKAHSLKRKMMVASLRSTSSAMRHVPGMTPVSSFQAAVVHLENLTDPPLRTKAQGTPYLFIRCLIS